MKTKTKENPETHELFEFINKSLAKSAFITIIAKCKINKNSGTKDRIIMIKPDSSFIIDDVTGSKPLDSLYPVSNFEIKIKNNIIILTGFSYNSRSLEVEIHNAYLASSQFN